MLKMSLRAKAAALFGASLKVMAFALPTFERTFWDTYDNVFSRIRK